MSHSVTLTITALSVAATGGLLFAIGLGAAFSRAGNWSNRLAEFGILFLAISAITLFSAFLAGVGSFIIRRVPDWTLLITTPLVAFAIYVLWTVANL